MAPLKLIVDQVGFNMANANSAGDGWCARQLRLAGGPGGVKKARDLYTVLPNRGYSMVPYNQRRPGDIYVQTHGGGGAGHTGIVAGSNQGTKVLSDYEGVIQFSDFGEQGFYFRPPKARPTVEMNWGGPSRDHSGPAATPGAGDTLPGAGQFPMPGLVSERLQAAPIIPLNGPNSLPVPDAGAPAPQVPSALDRIAQMIQGQTPDDMSPGERLANAVMNPGSGAGQRDGAQIAQVYSDTFAMINSPSAITAQLWEKWINDDHGSVVPGHASYRDRSALDIIKDAALGLTPEGKRTWGNVLHDETLRQNGIDPEGLKQQGVDVKQPMEGMNEAGVGGKELNFLTNAALFTAGVALDTFTNPLTYLSFGEGTAGKLNTVIAKIDRLWPTMEKSAATIAAEHFGPAAAKVAEAIPATIEEGAAAIDTLQNAIPARAVGEAAQEAATVGQGVAERVTQAVQDQLPIMRAGGTFDDLIHGGWRGKYIQQVAEHYAAVAVGAGADQATAKAFGTALARDQREILKAPVSLAGYPLKGSGRYLDLVRGKMGLRPLYGPSSDEGWVRPGIRALQRAEAQFEEAARVAFPDEQFTSIEQMYEQVRKPKAPEVKAKDFARAQRQMYFLDKRTKYMLDQERGGSLTSAGKHFKELLWGETSMPRNWLDAARMHIGGPRGYSSRMHKEVDALWGAVDEDLNQAVFDWNSSRPRQVNTKTMQGVYGRTTPEATAAEMERMMGYLHEDQRLGPTVVQTADQGDRIAHALKYHVNPDATLNLTGLEDTRFARMAQLDQSNGELLRRVHEDIDIPMIEKINAEMGFDAIRVPGSMGDHWQGVRAAQGLTQAMDDFASTLPGFSPTPSQRAEYKAAGHYFIDQVAGAIDGNGVVDVSKLPHLMTDMRLLTHARVSSSAGLQLLYGVIQMVKKEGVLITDSLAPDLIRQGWMSMLRVSPEYTSSVIAAERLEAGKIIYVEQLAERTKELEEAQRALAHAIKKEDLARQGGEEFDRFLAEEKATARRAPRPARGNAVQRQNNKAASDRMIHGPTYGGMTKAQYMQREGVGLRTADAMSRGKEDLFFYLWEDKRLTAKSYDDLAAVLATDNPDLLAERMGAWRKQYHITRQKDDRLVERLSEKVAEREEMRASFGGQHNATEPSEVQHDFFEGADAQAAGSQQRLVEDEHLAHLEEARANLRSRKEVEIERETAKAGDPNTAAAIKRGIESNYAVEEARIEDQIAAVTEQKARAGSRPLSASATKKRDYKKALEDATKAREEAQDTVDLTHETINQFWRAKGAQRDVEPLLAKYLVPPGVNALFTRAVNEVRADSVAAVITDILQTSWVRSNVLFTPRFHVFNMVDNFVVGPVLASVGPILAGQDRAIMSNSISAMRGLIRLSIRDLGFLPEAVATERLNQFENSIWRNLFPNMSAGELDEKIALADKWGVMNQGMYGAKAAVSSGGPASPVGEAMKAIGQKPIFKPVAKVLNTEAKMLEMNRRVGAMLEDIPRLGLFFQVLENGGSEKEAADAISRGFINYSNIVGRPFDNLMGKLMMFWPYLRQRATQTITTLVSHPGVGVAMYSGYKRMQGGSGTVVDMANDAHNIASTLVGSERDDHYWQPPVTKEDLVNTKGFKAVAGSTIGKELGMDAQLNAEGNYDGFRKSDRIALTWGRPGWIGPDYLPIYTGVDANGKLKMPAELRWAVEKLTPTENMVAENGKYYIMMRSALSPYEMLGMMRRLASRDVGDELTSWMIAPLKAPLDATDKGFPEMLTQLRNSYLFMGQQTRPLVGFAAQAALKQDIAARDAVEAKTNQRPTRTGWTGLTNQLLSLEGPRITGVPKAGAGPEAWASYEQKRLAAEDYARINNWRRLFAQFGIAFQLVPQKDMVNQMPGRIFRQFNQARIEEGKYPLPPSGRARKEEHGDASVEFERATR
ncbi:MAG: hypothetical protein ACYC63_16885 [Armatimonadota bacterium]